MEKGKIGHPRLDRRRHNISRGYNSEHRDIRYATSHQPNSASTTISLATVPITMLIALKPECGSRSRSVPCSSKLLREGALQACQLKGRCRISWSVRHLAPGVKGMSDQQPPPDPDDCTYLCSSIALSVPRLGTYRSSRGG